LAPSYFALTPSVKGAFKKKKPISNMPNLFYLNWKVLVLVSNSANVDQLIGSTFDDAFYVSFNANRRLIEMLEI
jgi:hypothetical protein